MKNQVRLNETNTVNHRFLKPRAITLMLLFLALIMGGVSTVSAADGDMIYVNDTGGSDSNNGTSWQYAKQSIKNATGTVNTNGTVHIANGTYKGSNNRGITINKSMNIIGQSQSGTIIDAEGSNRIFTINNGVNVTIQRLTLANGTVSNGGAIFNDDSSLTVSDCTFTNNTATGYYGGGAIYNDGALNVENSTFKENTATSTYGAAAGAISNNKGSVTVSDSTFTNNTNTGTSTPYGGGAIFNDAGSVTVTDSTFTENTSEYGGAIYINSGSLKVIDSTFTDNRAGYGGAIENYGTLTVSGSTFTGNKATGYGGAIDNYVGTLNVTSSTFTVNEANNGGAIFNDVDSVTVSDCTFTGNTATYDAGAIYNEGNSTVGGSTFTDNHAGDEGGAIYNNKGSMNVGGSIFTGNTADYIGGAIYLNKGSVTVSDCTFTGNTAMLGGAIRNNGGNLTVEDSTFTGNNATTIGGGAIHSTGSSDASVNINGSTFTGNKATGSNGNGGAIYNTSNTNAATFKVGGSTFTGNSATGNGGAIYNARAGTFKVHFSRIIGNTASEGRDVHFEPESYVGKGSVNATYNWWGSNDGPSSGRVSENVTVGPWLVLTVTAYPNLVSANGNSTITADLLHDSNGVYHDPADGHVPDGTSVQFSATLGAIPGVVTTSNGKAEATFAAGSTKGLANIRVTVDNETQTTIVNIGKDDLYVSPTGNDETGNGSPQYPFQTIRKAVEEVSSNGIVHLLNGTYKGSNNRGITINRSMNIIGQSQSGTIIDAEGSNRIFTINNGVNVTIQRLTLANGTVSSGGAIHNYHSSLSVSDCTFTGNTANYGGAIYSTDRSTLNISDCTFTGNTANYAGAIYNTGTGTVSDCTFTGNTANYAGAIYNTGTGTLTVSGSTFTGNTANYAGAIYNTGTGTVSGSTFTENNAEYSGGVIYNTGNLNVNSSTFTENNANSSGGAIFNSGSSTVHFSRFIGNIASQRQDIYSNNAVDASYNWWGSNSGPSSGRVSSGVKVGPWLVLTVTAHPAIIPANGKSTITADFLHDSNGASVRGHVPDGIPVTFTAANGTVNPESSTLFGIATSTFTATNGGAVKFAATVDNQTVSTTSTVLDPVSNFAGQNVNLTANVTDVNGDPANEGQVQFIVNNKEIGTSTVSNGKATFNWKLPDSWSVGNYNVVVNYWGTVNYHVSSGTGTLTVTRTPTNITVNTVNGHDVNLTANVTDVNGNPVNEGQVHFTVNGRTVGSAPVDENGIATFNGWHIPSTWSVKQYDIVAKYLGTANFSVSESTGKLTVDYISTSLTVDPASGSKGDSINLNAKLWDNRCNKPVEGKQVDFYVNDVKKGSGTTDKNGVATYKYTLTQNVGKYIIKAVFAVDTQYANADGNNILSIIDKTAPTIVSVNPANGATKVAANKTIKVTFSEEIKAGSLWIELKNSTGKAIPFNHTISGKVLTISTISNLSESLYTLIIRTGAVTDLAGNPVALKSTKFSVGTSPTVIKVDPVNGATKVAANKTIKVTFNESIKKGNLWIELVNGSKKAISFTTYISGKVLTIKPKSKLAESKYKLILHTGAVTDQAGNPLALKSFTFTTGTPPTITKTDPKNNAVNVARNKTIRVTFNENIKAGSNYWIELVDKNGAKIAIKKSIKGKVLTITHTAKLKANTKYKLILHTGSLTDTSGNPLALKTINFTTRT